MTLAWMLCYLAVGALLAIVATCHELVIAPSRMPRRAAWLGAMVLMCVLPLALPHLPAPLPLRDAGARAARLPATLPATAPLVQVLGDELAARAPALMPRITKAPGNGMIIERGSVLLRGDAVLPALWLGASLACLAVIALAARRMRRARRSWTLADTATSELVSTLAGRRVRTWISDDMGPAAFGVRRPQVVLPRWACALDEPARTLLLTHEASHVSARDPLLLRVALGLVVVMPWNVALVYAYRRLHRAVEQDCDVRVVRAGGDVQAYGRLLVDAVARRARATWLPLAAAGMGVQRSDLELRLRALVRPVVTWRTRVRSAAAAVAIVVAGLAACSVPAPKERADVTDSGLSGSRNDVGIATGFLAIADSIARVDGSWKALEKLKPQLDTLMVLAAHRMLPEVWSDTSKERQIWLLLDDRYDVRQATTGVRHNFVHTDVPLDGRDPAHATEQTPESLLVLTPASYSSAFPQTARQALRSMAGTATMVRGRRVRINWARTMKAETPGASATAREDRATSIPESLSVVASARARVLSAGFATPEAKEPVLVWLLYNSRGVELAHHVDRGFVEALPASAFAVPFNRIRTARTTEHQDIHSCDGLAERFNDTKDAARLTSCSMSVSVERPGERRVSLIMGVTQAPL